jgi:DNA polymerase I-like protein with 3'-5' exonuclease and polymerase domains
MTGFWDEAPPPLPSARPERFIPPPRTGWKPSRDFPNLTGAKILGIDTETFDPNLLTHGPGGVRGDGHIVGVSLATEDASWYFPVRHEFADEAKMNMDPGKVFPYLQSLVGKTERQYVGANIMYDLEWLRASGVQFSKKASFHDVQYAEPLLDEESGKYSLDALATKYLQRGKETSLLYQWSADSFGGKPDGTQRKNIWRSPPSLVGPYAEADAFLPLQILMHQGPRLEVDELLDVYDMERALIPMLLDMRLAGVRVDIDKARKVSRLLREKSAKASLLIPGIDAWSGDSIAEACKAAGIEYQRTATGKPSFTKEWLQACKHPMAKAILEVRKYDKAANPFVESYILNSAVKGRVYGQFHPLRSDENGTVSGRLSSSTPNLQNITGRDEELAPMLRGLFIPNEGSIWVRTDYSQIEYRKLVHFMVEWGLKGADALQQRYVDDPDTDFHQMCIDLVKEITGIALDRKPAKTINFGLVYGMGKEKLIASLGVSEELGNKLYASYFKALPGVKSAIEFASGMATREGYVTTILGRRKRFGELYENDYGRMEREHTHKALNSILQGSAADAMKRGMLACYDAGLLFNDEIVTHLTVHDELDMSMRNNKRARAMLKEIVHLQETAIKCHVPLIVDISEGKNWGECL